MPNAFRSLAREKEAKKLVKAAMGTADRQGWVHLDTVAVVDAAAAEREAVAEEGQYEQRQEEWRQRRQQQQELVGGGVEAGVKN